MRNEFVRIALPKLFLWCEPSRFQEYPAALARAQAGRVYTRLEVERELFDILPTLEYKGGIPRGRRTDGIVNTYGLELSADRYRINGINLLKRTKGGLVPTDEGLILGRLYRKNPERGEWPHALARQLLLREPRTRLLMGLMVKGYSLQVEFTGAMPTGTLALVDGSKQRTVLSQRNCVNFNELLSEYAEMAIGPLWLADLKRVGVQGDIRWEGVKGEHPSTNDLPTALKKPLAVFFHLNLFEGDGEFWNLDVRRLQVALGDEVATSFGIEVSRDEAKLSEEEAFTHALAETTDSEGFVIVSKLASRFGELLNVPLSERADALDAFVRKAMYQNSLRVIKHHPGQPRMGRGLFGDNGSRLVMIDFTPSLNTSTQVGSPGTSGPRSNHFVGGSQ